MRPSSRQGKRSGAGAMQGPLSLIPVPGQGTPHHQLPAGHPQPPLSVLVPGCPFGPPAQPTGGASVQGGTWGAAVSTHGPRRRLPRLLTFPYSNEYETDTVGPGSFPRFRISTQPRPNSWASEGPNRKPRESRPVGGEGDWGQTTINQGARGQGLTLGGQFPARRSGTTPTSEMFDSWIPRPVS